MNQNKEFDAVKYKNEYNSEHYERFTLLMPKGMKDDLKARAKEQGKSLSSYILDIVNERNN